MTAALGPLPSLETLSPARLAATFSAQDQLETGEALWLIDEAIRLISKERNVLRLEAPVRVVGDLHGQFFDLLSMLEMCGMPGEGDGEGEGGTYLFLGDYVDRGAYSCEVMLYLLALKLAHPDHVHLLRGNHECRALTGHFGFKEECKGKYGLPVYYRFVRVFEELPLAALVTNDHGRYLCAHGGLSPELATIDAVDALDRRTEPPMDGPLCDLLWADPSDDPSTCPPAAALNAAALETVLGDTFAFNKLRGCSVTFGYSAAVKFLEANDLLCIVRAHAVQENGYYRHFEPVLEQLRAAGGGSSAQEAGEEGGGGGGMLAGVHERPLPAVITVFSAPNYCGRYGNR
ncbi:Metallo-dependent phosphatase-like protein [Tribonema minus]|uniref:Serine/threonine-protein phosphatase n=1 Tax=Tribonema minus TaxID=303371 RepID=A0A835YV28_9STRA|nr:Metallo-dependent phosphatase-like protein [Tribonema minus]